MTTFQQIVDKGGFLDLGCKGVFLTLTNRQLGGANVRKRLDCALANVVWREQFDRAVVLNEAMIRPDYRPVILFL